MHHWITIVRHKPIASLNTLWYCLQTCPHYEIEHLTVFFDDTASDSLDWFMTQSKILTEKMGARQPHVNTIKYMPEDIDAFRNRLKEILHKSDGKIILDMTSGRKAHSSLFLLLGTLFSGKVEHVFYNFLEDAFFMDFPFPALPPAKYRIMDLLET